MRRMDLVPIEFPPDWIAEDTADASGVAQVEMPPAREGMAFLVERIVVATTSALASEARVYVVTPNQEQVSDTDLRDGTSAGDLDIADLTRPIRVPGGKSLRIRWTGMTPSTSQARAVVQYIVAALHSREV